MNKRKYKKDMRCLLVEEQFLKKRQISIIKQTMFEKYRQLKGSD